MPLDPAKHPTLTDVSKLDKGSGHDVIVEAIYSHAELALMPTSTQSGTDLDITVLTGLPGGNSFRRPNEGIQPSKSTFDTKRFDMALVDRRVEVDKDGVYARAKDKPRLLVNQSVPQMEKALSDVAKQVWYGKFQDANKGFPGLIAQAAQDAQHAVDATGTANLSTVWFLDLRPSSMELVFGEEGTLMMGDEWKDGTIFIAPNNDRLDVLINKIKGWVGFRLLNKNRAVQIRRIGIANGKTLTADMMASAMNLCQDVLGFTPTHIIGNGRSFEQLRQSLKTDLDPSPKRIVEWDGIPVVRSINIRTDEENV